MKFIIMVILCLFQSMTFAQVPVEKTLDIGDIQCPSSNIIGKALITDVCWEAMFPLYVGGVKLNGKSKFAPADRNTNKLCFCGGDLAEGIAPAAGVSVGMYLPKYLLTVTKKPYCFPELNGTELASQLGLVSRFNVGNEDMSNSDVAGVTNQASFSWHLAALPLTRILELFDVNGCFSDGYSTFDILWISETIPMWYDSELAYYVAPESIVFAGPLALAGIVADCVASSAIAPMDSIFFAAGCWGGMYPIASHVGNMPDKVAAKSLIASRALFFLSRIGVLERTMGEDAVCKAQKMPILKKSQYRFQQLWPLSESESMDVMCADEKGCDQNTVSSTLGAEKFGANLNEKNIEQVKMNSLNETCAHPIGQSTFGWGIWRDAKQSDHASYMIFQWNDCCGDLTQFITP
jgi:conjugal transfer pilus assembly protein TraU